MTGFYQPPEEPYVSKPYMTKPYGNLSAWLETLPESEKWHFLAFQPAKLIAENAISRYYLLLTNFEFIDEKLRLIGVTPLLLDYALGLTNLFVANDMKLNLIVARETVEQLGKLHQEYPALYTEWIQYCNSKGISPHVSYCTGMPHQKITLLQVWLQQKHPDFAVF